MFARILSGLLATLIIGFVGSVHAQQQEPPGETQGQQELQPEQRRYIGPGERPTPPPGVRLGNQQPGVVRGAGAGSPVAYASQGVVELGGTVAVTHQSQITTVRLSPLLGYFFVDNFELTLFPELLVQHFSDGVSETDWSLGALLEPSYHFPLSDRLLVFLGVGAGVRYDEDPGFDALFRPRLGLDVLIGRSGILKPAFFVDIGTRDGVYAGGFEASFTIML